MTRGMIFYIGKDKRVYRTTEFNGDMFPENGNGADFVEKFQQGGFSTFADFKKFVEKFDRRHYGYAEYGEDIIHLEAAEINEKLDVHKYFSDYMYIINKSEISITVICRDGEHVLNPHQMLILYYNTFDQVIEYQGDKNNIPMSKIRFVTILKQMQDAHELVENAKNFLKKM